MADEPLDDALRTALQADVPATRGPSEARIAALRAAALAHAGEARGRDLRILDEPDDARVPAEVAIDHRAPAGDDLARRRSRRAVVALGAAAAVVAFVLGTIVASSPPSAVRDVAHGLGLDVESNDLVAARARLQDLGVALATATERRVDGRLTDSELDAVAIADRDMLASVAELDEGERTQFVPTAHQVHLRAVELFLAEGRDLPTAKPGDLEEIRRGG